MGWNRRNELGKGEVVLPRLIILAVFFFAGIFFGQVISQRVPDKTGVELTDYLRRYMALEKTLSPGAALSALTLYIRYPLLAVLLGFASIGAVLLPFLTTAFGFFLSFSVCCFTAAFGSNGVLLAMAVFGLRCAVTLPCYFLLAVPAWGTAATLARLSFGKTKRTEPITYGRAWWARIGTCTLVLLAGTCIDLVCSPWLMQLVLDQIFL